MRQQHVGIFSVLLMIIQGVRHDMRRYMYARVVRHLPIYHNLWKTYCDGVYEMGHKGAQRQKYMFSRADLYKDQSLEPGRPSATKGKT